MAKPYYMNWCSDLIVRIDIGHTRDEHGIIATMSCKAEAEGRSCPNRGVCAEARAKNGDTRVSSKTFGAK